MDRNNVGDVVYGERDTFGPRKQPHLQLVYFYNGEIALKTNRTQRVFHGGEALFLIPGETYHFTFDPLEKVRHGWVDLPTIHEPPPWATTAEDALAALPFTERMRALASIANDAPRDSADDEGDLRRALGRAIVEEAFAAAGHKEDTKKTRLPPAVLRAESIMMQHFPDKLSLDEIAAKAGVSKPHLIRLFREHTSTTPARHLWEIRVEAGARLLRETGLQMQEIADRCGFPSPYHFSRLLKKRYGVSPTKYRQQAWSGDTGRK